MELMIIDERTVLGNDFRVYGDMENPLFLAKDVAMWIEYDQNDINKLIAMVDDEEKLARTIFWSGQRRKMWFLTEDGLYEVLMQSRKPIAKQFKKEVKRILKEIRLTGSYIPDDAKIENFARMVSMLQPETLRLVAIETQAYARRVESEHRLITAEYQDLKAEGAVRDAEIRLLKHEELTWADRDFIIAAVKKLGGIAFRRVGNPALQMKYAWGMFYKELAYRYRISIRNRSIDQSTGKPMKINAPRMNVLRDHEVPKAVATIVALCHEKGVSLADMICRLNDPSIAYDPLYVDPMRVYRMGEAGNVVDYPKSPVEESE